ncbi:MAG TPA: 30S ribosomal protein S20 [Candidatus Eisenbacteria bacterium]|nr:30S ribosomal protein S20 [Candidatus Eisenbacteria bacterium]
MPHHKSAKKRVRTNEVRRLRNVEDKSRVRGAIKAVRSAATREEAQAALKSAVSTLDRAAKKGVLKSGTADRQKSRLTVSVSKRFA